MKKVFSWLMVASTVLGSLSLPYGVESVEAAEDEVVWVVWDKTTIDGNGIERKEYEDGEEVDFVRKNDEDGDIDNNFTEFSNLNKYRGSTYWANDNFEFELTTKVEDSLIGSVKYIGDADNPIDFALPDKLVCYYSVDVNSSLTKAIVKKSEITITSTEVPLLANEVPCKSAVFPSYVENTQDFNLGKSTLESLEFKGDIRITNDTFKGYDKLQSVVFGGADNYIGKDCFTNCSLLENMTWPVKSIGSDSFAGCTSLKKVKSDSVVSLGQGAFKKCSSLETVVLPSLEEIGEGFQYFLECPSLRYVYAPKAGNALAMSMSDSGKVIGDVIREGLDAVNENGISVTASSSIGTITVRSPFLDVDSISVTMGGSDVVCTPVMVDGADEDAYSVLGYNFELLRTGTYSINATDDAGNVLARDIVFGSDSAGAPQEPIIRITGEGSDDYYQIAEITVVDNQADLKSVIVNDDELYSGSGDFFVRIRDEGTYHLRAEDAAGNVVEKTFYVDSTAPTISSPDEGAEVDNPIYFFFEDNFGIASAWLGDRQIKNGDVFVWEGAGTLEVKDKAGNVATRKFIGKPYEKPVPETDYPQVVGIDPGGAYNVESLDLTFTSPVGIASVTIDGEAVSINGVTISEEGEHRIILTDINGLERTVWFSIDRTPPRLPVDNGMRISLHNTSFICSFSDSESYVASATLNGEEIESGHRISDPGQYVLEVTDAAGNVSKAIFSIVTTEEASGTGPVISGVVENGVYPAGVYVEYSDDTMITSLDLDGEKRSMSTSSGGMAITTLGEHTITVTDDDGNEASVRFYVDGEAPTSSVSSGMMYNVYNKDLVLTFSDDYAGVDTAVLNDKLIEDGYAITGDSVTARTEFNLVVTDKVGNSRIINFIVVNDAAIANDDVAPIITGVVDDGIYSGAATIGYYDDVGISSATIDGASFESGYVCTAVGHHFVSVTDVAGNRTSVSFAITKSSSPDVTGPTLSVKNGEVYSGTVIVTATDPSGVSSLLLNGTSVGNNTVVKENGKYVVLATDSFGNKTKVTFYVGERTNDENALSGLENDKHYREAVSFTIGSGSSATLNGVSVSGKVTVSESGNYTLLVSDSVGNTTQIKFVVDLNAPKIIIKPDSDLAKSFQVTVKDANLKSVKVNGKTVSKKFTLDTDGVQRIVAKDKAGNTATETVTVDATAPTFNVTDDKVYKKTIKVTAKDSSDLQWVKLNNKKIKNGTKITKGGVYTVKAKDAAGCVGEVTFTVDLKSPTVSGAKNGKTYKKAVTVKVTDDGSGIKSVKIDGKRITKTKASNGVTLKKKGTHKVVAYDKLNRKTVVKFKIA